MTTPPPFRAIAESTYDWEMWIDESGTVRWINRAVERFVAASVDECLAMTGFPLPFVFLDDRPLVESVMERASRGEMGNDLEFRILGRTHEPEWVSISFQTLVDESGASRGYRTSIRDIALRKEHERLVAESERDAARRAEERTELLATLSHELRTPLHCIAGFTELLLEEELDARSRRFLSLVADQSNGALRLVEDLLQFAAGPLREPTLRAVPVDLDALVVAQLDSLRGRAKPGVRLEIDSHLGESNERIGDADRLRQVVANLVSNALRFTDSGSVVVRLTEAADPDVVILDVVDTGLGMDASVLAQSKRAFFQGDGSHTSSRGGVGLGLAIVEQLAAALSGDLTIESEPGRGTHARVTLRLPRRSVSIVPADSTLVPRDASFSSLDVLVVDDVDASRELVVAMLASVGVVARSARSGDEALAACEALRPSMILLDYHMPGRDGVETAEAIVATLPPGEPRPTIAILTANVLAQSRSAAIDRWMTKPLRRTELVGLLRRIVRPAILLLDPELDDEVLRELEECIPGAAVSILASKGRALATALDEAIERTLSATDDVARTAAAHGARGLAAMLGARALERRAGELEERPTDRDAIAAFSALRLPTLDALAARIERGAKPSSST